MSSYIILSILLTAFGDHICASQVHFTLGNYAKLNQIAHDVC